MLSKKTSLAFCRFLVAVLACAFTASCGFGTANNNTSSSSSSKGAQLSVTPSSMNFGSVNVGTSQAKNGTLTAGSSAIVVSSASWNGSGYTLTGITFPTTIPAGSTLPFTVTFAPQTAGSTPGQVAFLSNATDSNLQVALNGSGVQPAAPHSVDLSWDASPSQVVGYNLYRGTQAAGPYGKLNSSLIAGLTFVDTSVQSGNTYYYVATAVDSSQVESGYSNVGTAVIP